MEPINQQAHGPLSFEPTAAIHPAWDNAVGKLKGADGAYVAEIDGGATPTQATANRRVVCAGFALLDKTARALNVDAAELGAKLDLARTIRFLDGLSDMIEGGRLTRADIPDDYQWLVDELAAINQPLPS